jgi:phosphate transport system permease protein
MVPVSLHSPVPEVRPHPPNAAVVAATTPVRQPGRGVKLAKISRTGDLAFRALTGGSSGLIVLLVIFVGVFLLALALPSLLADKDNFLTSRNWIVAGNELRFGILGLLWTTVLSSVLAMAISVPIAVGVALCLTHYLPRRAFTLRLPAHLGQPIAGHPAAALPAVESAT